MDTPIALIEVGEEERQGLENLNYDGAKGWEAFAVVPIGLDPGQYFAFSKRPSNRPATSADLPAETVKQQRVPSE